MVGTAEKGGMAGAAEKREMVRTADKGDMAEAAEAEASLHN